MTPEQLPLLMREGAGPLEERVFADLPADLYSLEELRVIVRVLEKYAATVELLYCDTPGGMQ